MSSVISNTITNDDPNQPFFFIDGMVDTEVISAGSDDQILTISNTVDQRMKVYELDGNGDIVDDVTETVFFVDKSSVVVPDQDTDYLVIKLALDFYKSY